MCLARRLKNTFQAGDTLLRADFGIGPAHIGFNPNRMQADHGNIAPGKIDREALDYLLERRPGAADQLVAKSAIDEIECTIDKQLSKFD